MKQSNILNNIDLIVLTYNREDTLETALRSVADWKFINAICVDHYSKDRSVEIFKKYFPNGKVLYENRGLGYARTIAIREVRSEFFLFLDSDVILPADFLSLVCKFFSVKSVGAIQGKRYMGDPLWGKVIESRGSKTGYRLLKKHDRPFTGATLLRTEAAKQVDLTKYKMMEDYFLMRHIQQKGYLWLECLVSVQLKRSSFQVYGNVKTRSEENEGAATRLYGIKGPGRFFLDRIKYSLRDSYYALRVRRPEIIFDVIRVHRNYIQGYLTPRKFLS